MNSDSVTEFEKRCEAKREAGLVDLKFCTTSSTTKLAPEAFCEEANTIDDALARGDFEVYTFGDASK